LVAVFAFPFFRSDSGFTFDGAFERGPGKKPDEEAYYLLRGALTRFSTDAEKKVTSQVTQVEFKSFPRDAAPPQ
jgi:hypothetical protein